MITDREWKQIQKRWFSQQQFEFRVDGDRVALRLTTLKGGKLAYRVYVNGWILTKAQRGGETPERRYYPERETFYFSAVERRDHLLRRTLKMKLTGKSAEMLTYWRSFKQFKKQMLSLRTPDGQPSSISRVED